MKAIKTIFEKSSITDIWQGRKYVLVLVSEVQDLLKTWNLNQKVYWQISLNDYVIFPFCLRQQKLWLGLKNLHKPYDPECDIINRHFSCCWNFSFVFANLDVNKENRNESKPVATSKMERFVIIVNGWKPLTIITKCPILDVAEVLDPPVEKVFTW